MSAIISVEGLGKKYRIQQGQQGAQPGQKTFRELITALPTMLKARLQAPAQHSADMEDFWALQDVSFDVQPGERVGIIGRNGAGKSTLLKLLSRITEPSKGKITLRGRLASLLEVGTGFHPELTGRENIFLNGAILGMSRAEVRRKFDEIVDFSGVEKFLDMPVKRYSSGMYVRLAFGVAAHLEPEILVVDEVLAVGDADFQKKCLGKMQEVGKEGRTVLFVSHNMAMIEALCTRCILLEKGQLVVDAPTAPVVARYFGVQAGECAVDFSSASYGDGGARLLRGALTRPDGTPAWEFDLAEPICIHMEYEILQDQGGPSVPNFHFTDASGAYLCVDSMRGVQHGNPGRYCVTCTVPPHLFNAGPVCIGLALTSYGETGLVVHFSAASALAITVSENIFDNPQRYGYGGVVPGPFRPHFAWSGGLIA